MKTTQVIKAVLFSSIVILAPSTAVTAQACMSKQTGINNCEMGFYEGYRSSEAKVIGNFLPVPKGDKGTFKLAWYKPVAVVPTPTPRRKIVAALLKHRVCTVTYSSNMRIAAGTILAETNKPYKVLWNGSKWVVKGSHPKYPFSEPEFAYPLKGHGPSPKSNTYNHWGRIFVIDKHGNVYNKREPDFQGVMNCG